MGEAAAIQRVLKRRERRGVIIAVLTLSMQVGVGLCLDHPRVVRRGRGLLGVVAVLPGSGLLRVLRPKPRDREVQR